VDSVSVSPIESISAVTLLVSDMAESIVFYEMLGFQMLYGGKTDHFTSFKVGGGYLNIALAGRSTSSGLWGRVIFYVIDVDHTYQRAVAAGLVPEMEPSDAAWGERYFHLRDPDGNELSFARPL